MTTLKTENIDGLQIKIQVSDTGEFSAQLDGDWVKAPSLKALKEKLLKQVRGRGRIAVPATLIEDRYRDEGAEITHIVLTGIHSGNSNPLYLEAGATGAPEQLRWSTDTVYRRLTEADLQTYHQLRADVAAADAALEVWKATHRLHPATAIREAQKALHPEPVR